MPTFHTLHTIETVLALVGASLLIKGIEKCPDKYCSNTETNQIVHEAAETMKHDVDEIKEFHDDEHKTLTARSEPESTVYNFATPGSPGKAGSPGTAHNPTKVIKKENKKINVSKVYVHLQ